MLCALATIRTPVRPSCRVSRITPAVVGERGDVVAIAERGADRSRIRVVELEGGVEVLVVVGQVADVADLRLEVVARIGLVPPLVTGATDRQPSSSRFPSMTILPLSREMLTSSPLGGGAAAVALEAGAAINNRHASRRRPERRESIARLDGTRKFRVLRFVPGRHGSSQLTQPMTYNSRVPMEGEMRRTAAVFVALVLGCGLMVSNVVRSEAPDARLKGAVRRAPVNGWTYVRLEGTPAEIGFQHGYLLAPEIQDLERVFSIEIPHDTGHDWAFFRDAAEHMLWPHIEQEYREELQGIADGIRRRASTLDLWDVVAVNAALEWSYYTEAVRQAASAATARQSTPRPTTAAPSSPPAATRRTARSSSRTTTGAATRRRALDDRVRHAAGTGPSLRDGRPARRDSQRPTTSASTTRASSLPRRPSRGFSGFDVNGVPEFVRARKAMQYGASIDEVAADLQGRQQRRLRERLADRRHARRTRSRASSWD